MAPKLSPLAIGILFVAALLLMSLVGAWHYADDLIQEAIEKEARPKRVAQYSWHAEQRERAGLSLPLYHPLACPQEDERGRPLTVTMKVVGERKMRCYFGSAS